MIVKLPDKSSRFYIIQDTHFWDRNLANRKDYKQECDNIYDSIIEILDKCTTDKKYLIFLGDIFHSKFHSEVSFNHWVQKFLILRAKCNGIFSVVGNHELTYVDHNPFWSLINEVESVQLQSIGCKALGNLPIVRVVDYIDIFDFRFNFNHYGQTIENYYENTSFLLSHNYWLSDELKRSMRLLGNVQVDSRHFTYNEIRDDCDLMYFDEVFLGHNHMMIGDYTFKWNDDILPYTNVHFCGSLGLTNKNEVLKTPDYRNIYYIDIINQGNYKVDFFSKPLLKKDSYVIDDFENIESTEKYNTEKYKKSLIKKYDLSLMDPIQAIEKDLQNDIYALELFKTLEKGSVPEWMQQLI